VSVVIDYFASEPEVARLRSALLAGDAIDRVSILVSLAWHLRQRDARHALELAAAAEPLLVIPDPSRRDQMALRARLQLVRAEIAGLYAEFDRADRYLAEATHLFEAGKDLSGMGDAAGAGAFLARLKGDLEQERDGWVAARSFYEQAGDRVREAIAEAWTVLAEIPLARGGTRAPSVDLTLQPSPNGSRAVDALRWAGAGLISEGARDPARSAASWTRAHDGASATGMVYVAVYSALMAARAFLRLGDPDGAKDWCERGFELARPTGWPHLLGSCHMLSGGLFYEMKEMGRSHEALLQAIPISGPNRTLCHLFLARTLLALNRPEAALETVDAVGGGMEDGGDPLNQCAMLIERARALAGVTRYGEAADQIEIARAIARRTGITVYDVVFLEVMATLYESSCLPTPSGRSPAQATYDCLKEALAVGCSRPDWRPPSALLKRLARAAAGNDDRTAAFGYYERALTAADQETARRLQNRIAANQIQDDLARARRDAELHIQKRRAATEGRRADELQAALDAMRAAQAVLAQRTAEFERLSLLDPLTGVANRRHLDQRAASEIAIIRRKSTSLGLILFDIDRFKGINDAHGHGFGDRVICEVVEIARAQLRPSDFIARIGGEEFTILLPDAGLEGGETIANRIRAAIAEHVIDHDDMRISVTASFGVTALTPDRPAFDAALNRADAALYAAKKGGRNRVCLDETMSARHPPRDN
jgi:diguanylate cyclase (GGDEF)-like protein